MSLTRQPTTACCLLLASLGALPAHAAQPAQEVAATGLETVTVSARRREESLTRVPASITALGADTIEELGITSVSDYTAQVPNVSFQAPLNFNDLRISVRGVSQIQGGQPPVAMVVDGVQLLSPTQFNVEQFDLERIEFLKGPQGAVYGRNAIMGAINVVTRAPSQETEGYLRLKAGSGDDYGVTAAIGGELLEDKITGRLVGTWRDRRGQLRNQTNGLYVDAYDDASVRTRLMFTPSDAWTIDLKAGYSQSSGGDVSYQGLAEDGRANDNDATPDTDTLGFNDRDILDGSLAINWESGFGTLSFNTAYFDSSESLLGDFDASPLAILAAYQRYDESGTSQELRYTSNASGAVRWIAGLYHLQTRKRTTTTLHVDSGFAMTDGAGPLSGDMLALTNIDWQRFSNFAQFAQMEVDLNDQLELALALRNDSDDTKVTADTGERRGFRVSKLQPKVTLTYRPYSQTSLYVSYGEGFRSGGLNPTSSPPGFDRFRAEEARTAEVGFKSPMLGNLGYVSAAVFHTELQDAQQLILDATSGSNIGLNVDDARLQGAELEFGLRPLPGLTLSGGVGVTRSEIRRFSGNDTLVGNDLPRVPDYTYALGVSYEHPLTPAMDLFTRADFTGEGEMAWHVDNADHRRSYEHVGLRLGLRESAGVWEATAWVKNLGDVRVTPDFQALEFTGFPVDVYAPIVGRTWGVEWLRNF